ncbi:MAG: hypothetical protein LJE70_00065, partial [Chromatiaceae bacterium]|nr:hypothetical protein [Chromatiaceae bacterium]
MHRPASKNDDTTGALATAPVNRPEDVSGFRPDMFLSRTFKRHHGQSYVPVALVGLLGIFATLTMFSRVGDLER